MAGIFGFFDYTKPGKGVEKDEPPKPRFLLFWELFFRKFWKLVQLNLLYIAFCLPVVTIGPATAGFTFVLRNLANEKPVFLFSDFWDAFKSNLKQSFAFSVILAVFSILISVALQFYSANLTAHQWMVVPIGLSAMVALIFVFSCFYVFLMIVTLELPLFAILKNAAILAICCLKTNLLTLLFTGLLVLANLLFIPYSAIAILLLTPAWIGFIICFNSYKGIHKYVIEPFLNRQDTENGALEISDET